MMRIGFFADGPWGHRSFEKIAGDNRFQLAFVVARSDSADEILEGLAKSHNLPFYRHKNVNSQEFIQLISGYKCDILVSMSFNQIFRAEIQNLTRFGIINCHAGMLPSYRGRNILNWALINGETEFGVTVHHVDDGIDTGDIILQRSCPITATDDYKSLLDKAYDLCPSVLHDALIQLSEGTATRTPQATSLRPVSYCSMRVPGDEKVDWDQPSLDVHNFIRALTPPGPAAQTSVDGTTVSLFKSSLVPNAGFYKGIPGAVLQVDPLGILVKTKDSFIRVETYISEKKIRTGDRLK